jgi:hypothetical protein
MDQRSSNSQDRRAPQARKFRVPAYKPPTAAELERQQRLYEEAAQLREEAGRIDISTSDLIRRFRDGGEDDSWQFARSTRERQEHAMYDRSTRDLQVDIETLTTIDIPEFDPPT